MKCCCIFPNIGSVGAISGPLEPSNQDGLDTPLVAFIGTLQQRSFLTISLDSGGSIVRHLDEFSVLRSDPRFLRKPLSMLINCCIACFCRYTTAGMIHLSHSILVSHRTFRMI